MPESNPVPRKFGIERIALAVAVAFWPVFGIIEVTEERSGREWAFTANPRFWGPLAVGCALFAAVGPLFSPHSFRKRLFWSATAISCYILSYASVALVGASFFGWSD